MPSLTPELHIPKNGYEDSPLQRQRQSGEVPSSRRQALDVFGPSLRGPVVLALHEHAYLLNDIGIGEVGDSRRCPCGLGDGGETRLSDFAGPFLAFPVRCGIALGRVGGGLFFRIRFPRVDCTLSLMALVVGKPGVRET